MTATRVDYIGASNTTDASSFVTASSISPPAGELLITWLSNSISAGTATLPTMTGNGLTWTRRATVTYDGGLKRMTLFTAYSATTPTPGNLTFDFGGITQSGANWSVEGIQGMHIVGTDESTSMRNITTKFSDAGSTSGTITIPACISSDSAVFACFLHNTNDAGCTSGVGYTQTVHTRHSSPGHDMQRMWRDNSGTTPSAAGWSAGSKYGAIAFELLTPIKRTTLDADHSTIDGSVFSTKPITPGANRLVLVTVVNNWTVDVEPTLTGCNLTWVKEQSLTATSGNNFRTTMFRSMGAAPTADDKLLIDFAGTSMSSCIWSVEEFDGVDPSGVNGSGAMVQSTTMSTGGVGTTVAATLGPGTVGNTVFGALGLGQNTIADPMTPGSGLTLISSIDEISTATSLATEWANEFQTTIDFTWVTSTRARGVAAEIRYAGFQPGAFIVWVS